MLVNKFFDAGRKFLECEIPIMCSAMTWVCDYKLVGAIGNAGGSGFLHGGNASVEVLGKGDKCFL